MKQIIIIALLVVIAFTYNGAYPRSKTSCQDQHVQGLFWDGQKCDVCANEYCYCTDYLGCSKCVNGYSKYTIQGLPDTREKCYDCNYRNGQLSHAGEIKECCFHGETNEFDYDKYKYDNQIELNPFKQERLENEYLIPRAISCKLFGQNESQPWQNSLQAELSKGINWSRGLGQSRRYGSYCLNYAGCVAYNNYGQCFECAEGYFLYHHNGSAVCKECPSNCTKCGADGQCQECAPHYFLKTQKSRISFESLARETSYASHCEECAENCLCDGKIVNTGSVQDEEQKCNLGCVNKYYLLTKGEDGAQDHCKVRCPDECSECKFGTGEESTKVICIKCHTEFPVNGSFYAPINAENTCLECPANCHACRLMPDGKSTTCLQDKCDNGYYPVTSSQRTTCKSCKTIEGKGNVLRCDSAKLITQCESNAGSSQTIVYDNVHSNFDLQYHKVGEGENAVCIQNQRSCKKIKANASQGNQNVDCESCYTDRGFHLKKTETQVICYNNQSQDCKRYSASGLCEECINGRQSTLNGSKFEIVLNYRIKDGVCYHCNNGCLSCGSDGLCAGQKCQNGYYYSDSRCQQCTVDYCDECTTDACKSCAPGWTIWQLTTTPASQSDYKCVKCPHNCTNCKMEAKSSDRRTCTECANGYYLSQGTCYYKRVNCARQKDNGDCEFCEYGYRVVAGYCLPGVDIPAGYINIEYGCGTNHRVRDDGHLLNREEFSDVYQPLNSNIVKFSAVVLAVLALLL